jgi:hypothetical protein
VYKNFYRFTFPKKHTISERLFPETPINNPHEVQETTLTYHGDKDVEN